MCMGGVKDKAVGGRLAYRCKVSVSLDGHCQLSLAAALIVYNTAELPHKLFEYGIVCVSILRGFLHHHY